MSHINPLINFDRPQEHIDSTLVQALDNYEASQVPHHLQQQSHNLGRQQHHQSHHNQQHHQLHQQNNQFASHQTKQHDQSSDSRLLQQVPIDPSINDSATSKEADAAVVAAAAAADLMNARNTAQAAVNSSNNMNKSVSSRNSNGGNISSSSNQSNGPKISKPRVNKPGQKFGAKKKSWVWNWFIQDPVDSNIATCDFCGKVIKRLPSDKGSPKKLGEHLKTHKITKDSLNTKRDSMIVGDANRHYFNTLNSNQEFKHHPLSNQTNGQSQQSSASSQQISNSYNRPQPTATSASSDFQSSNNSNSTSSTTANTNLDKSEFDQSAYSQPKFQKDIMKFLVENKLPLSIVKSPSFRQVIFTLKPQAIPDLNELNHLYSSLLEVIHNEKSPLDNDGDVDVDVRVTSDDQNISNNRVSHHDENVDDSLTNTTGGWV